MNKTQVEASQTCISRQLQASMVFDNLASGESDRHIVASLYAVHTSWKYCIALISVIRGFGMSLLSSLLYTE